MAMKIEYMVVVANATKKIDVLLLDNANATGTCNKDNQEIKLTWNVNNSVTLKFKPLKDKRFALYEIDVAVFDSIQNSKYNHID